MPTEPRAEAGASVSTLQRLTQPDWCNVPQPGNWHHACMRAPGHDGDHAVRKHYRMDEAWFWPAHGGYPVRYTSADRFPDLWHPDVSGPPLSSAESADRSRSVGPYST